MAEHFDYVVIGAGPGGYSSAIRAAQLGKKTAVIEKENAGGVCLNWGCIPTKALLSSAHLVHKLQSGKLNISIDGQIKADLPGIIDRSRGVADRLQNGIKALFKKYGVTLIEGTATLEGPDSVRVDAKAGAQKVKFTDLCIATGASARPLPALPFSKNVWQYRDALVQKKLPQSLVVIGGGAIGLEFADFYQCLGTKVTLVEMAPHILPNDDTKVALALRKALQQNGMDIFEGCQLSEFQEAKDSVTAQLETSDGKKSQLKAEAFLIAIGVVPNTKNMGLEELGIVDERGFLKVDANLRTSKDHIYAIGDVTPGKLLAHRAAHQGIFVAEKIAGHQVAPIPEIPGCIYTSPQVATIGLSETDLTAQKRAFKASEFPWMASGMALAAAVQSGFSRVFTDTKTGEILGAQIVGENAAELIGQVSLAMGSELLADDFLHAVMPHPTLSETIAEAFAVSEEACVNF
jgi:dihydrolipoamide dehydrogenase